MRGEMADYDDDDDFIDYGALPINEQREFLYDQIGFEPGGMSGHNGNEIHDLFQDYFYNDALSGEQREDIGDQLREVFWEEFGIDFWDVWDWDDFRSWYDAA